MERRSGPYPWVPTGQATPSLDGPGECNRKAGRQEDFWFPTPPTTFQTSRLPVASPGDTGRFPLVVVVFLGLGLLHLRFERIRVEIQVVAGMLEFVVAGPADAHVGPKLLALEVLKGRVSSGARH